MPDHPKVIITIQLPPVEDQDEELESWHRVYAGLSDSYVREIESVVATLPMTDNYFIILIG